MGPPETENRVQGTPKRHFSSPAPGLREPTRHLLPALPAHTLLTPRSSQGAATPHAPAAASPCGAAPAFQGVCEPAGLGWNQRDVSWSLVTSSVLFASRPTSQRSTWSSPLPVL